MAKLCPIGADGYRPGVRRVLPLVLLAASLAGCGDGGGDERIVVLAASSLSDAFDDITATYDGDVDLSYAASSAIKAQSAEGAPADVIALAEPVDGGEVFATNRLAIVVAIGNPEHITGLADLAGPDRRVALAAPSVPAGRYAAEAFAKAGVDVPDASQEENVRAVVARVASGEADAGVAYVTDIEAGGDDVDAVEVPDEHNVIARYGIDVVSDADGARRFAEHVLGDEGRAVLERPGFGLP